MIAGKKTETQTDQKPAGQDNAMKGRREHYGQRFALGGTPMLRKNSLSARWAAELGMLNSRNPDNHDHTRPLNLEKRSIKSGQFRDHSNG
jgi:hypothetical protein